MKRKIFIIGLTGGIGMGKSTAAKIFAQLGLPVYDADKEIHKLMKKGGKAVKKVAKLFPAALDRGSIDRSKLGHLVLHDKTKLKELEAILHPLVRDVEIAFLKKAVKQKKPAVVLEIPLLFETGSDKRCDITICVTAPPAVQAARVMQRKGMTTKKLKAILKRQMPDKKKRQLADYVIDTGKSYSDTKKQLQKILKRYSLAPSP